MGLEQRVLDFIEVQCWCGHPVLLANNAYNVARRDGTSFSCPLGHSFGWSGEVDKLKAKVAELERLKTLETQAKWRAQNEAAQALAKHDRLKRRVSKGVCPSCHRTFANVARHCAMMHKA